MYDAIILSDVHIGSDNFEAHKLQEFLDVIKGNTQRLIINGDLFDSFDSRLRKSHWKVLGKLRKLSDNLELIWVKGNHDTLADAETVSAILGTNFFEEEYVFESGGKSILIVHGDRFDNFLTDHPWLTIVADWIYGFIQKVKLKGISKLLKHRAKKYLRCHEKVEERAKVYLQQKGHDIVCCGHIHYAEEKDPYYNSGCWTESPPSYLAVQDGKVTLHFLEEGVVPVSLVQDISDSQS